jgi:hypothetical protein
MVITSKDLWLYQNREYIEVHERLLEAGNALVDLEEEMAEKRERLASQSAEYKAARLALRELREQLMAAHSAEDKK